MQNSMKKWKKSEIQWFIREIVLAIFDEKIDQQFALKHAKFEVFAIELMNIH